MRTLEELNSELKVRMLILSKAITLGNDAFYLNSPNTESEKFVADNYQFIRNVRVAYWIIAVLEMNKLYGKKNDHFTLKKLLNKLLDNHENSEWKNSLRKITINDWIKKLDSPDIQDSVNKIQGLRDQFYAHTDKNPKESMYDTSPTIPEFKALATFATEIIATIRVEVFNVHLIIETPGDGRADEILNELVELNNFRGIN